MPLPGPNAALTALIASGLDARQFVFAGFLPRTTGSRKALLTSLAPIPFTLIFYESPRRLKETLRILKEALGSRRAVTARELTKKFETFQRGTLDSLLGEAEEKEPRGEYVILVEGASQQGKEQAEAAETTWQEEAEALAQSMPVKEAARKIALTRNLARRDVYQYLLSLKK